MGRGRTLPTTRYSMKPKSLRTDTNIIPTKPLVPLTKLESPSDNHTIIVRTNCYSVRLAQGWSTAALVVKNKSMGSLSREDILFTMFICA